MNILLVCAMEKEANVFIKHYNLKKLTNNFYKNNNISLIITDISRNGVVNSLYNLSKNYDIENSVIINIGLVGSNNLQVGDIVCVNQSFGYHFDLTPFGDPLYNAPFSPYNLDTIDYIKNVCCYTSDGFVLNTNITDTCVFDMELNSIVLFPHKKIYAIKVVSDTLDKNLYNDFDYNKAMNNCLIYIDKIINEQN